MSIYLDFAKITQQTYVICSSLLFFQLDSNSITFWMPLPCAVSSKWLWDNQVDCLPLSRVCTKNNSKCTSRVRLSELLAMGMGEKVRRKVG